MFIVIKIWYTQKYLVIYLFSCLFLFSLLLSALFITVSQWKNQEKYISNVPLSITRIYFKESALQFKEPTLPEAKLLKGGKLRKHGNQNRDATVTVNKADDQHLINDWEKWSYAGSFKVYNGIGQIGRLFWCCF